MTNPHADAERTYSDEEIGRILESWARYRTSANPRDWYVATDIAEAIIRQLRAERDAARAEVEGLKRMVAELDAGSTGWRKPTEETVQRYYDLTFNRPSSATEPTGGREGEE